ncbi:hypothetical protein OROGR_032275 [Orobanche gracilis]
MKGTQMDIMQEDKDIEDIDNNDDMDEEEAHLEKRP